MDAEEQVNEFLGELPSTRWFTVKYNNTENNESIHKAFIEFSWAECDGNYLLAIKKLLENYSDDYRYSLLMAAIDELKGSVIGLQEGSKKVEKEKVLRCF